MSNMTLRVLSTRLARRATTREHVGLATTTHYRLSLVLIIIIVGHITPHFLNTYTPYRVCTTSTLLIVHYFAANFSIDITRF